MQRGKVAECKSRRSSNLNVMLTFQKTNLPLVPCNRLKSLKYIRAGPRNWLRIRLRFRPRRRLPLVVLLPTGRHCHNALPAVGPTVATTFNVRPNEIEENCICTRDDFETIAKLFDMLPVMLPNSLAGNALYRYWSVSRSVLHKERQKATERMGGRKETPVVFGRQLMQLVDY